eukprot:2646473-Amphidinium_carterae.2
MHPHLHLSIAVAMYVRGTHFQHTGCCTSIITASTKWRYGTSRPPTFVVSRMFIANVYSPTSNYYSNLSFGHLGERNPRAAKQASAESTNIACYCRVKICEAIYCVLG